MKLVPFDPAKEALEAAGILAKKVPKNPVSKVQEILDEQGATIEYAAQKLTEVLRNGEPNEILSAVKLLFQAQGVLREAEKPTMPAISINIIGKGEQKNLLQLITPNEIPVLQE